MRLGDRRLGMSRLRLVTPRALPAHMRGPVVELTALHTALSHRRQGMAERLMAQTTAEADRSRTFLFIHVDPEGDGPDQAALAQFYGRHGFVPIQADPLLMVRPSNGVGGNA